MQSFSLGQNQISILPGRRPDAPVIYLPSVKDEGACISRYLLESGCPDLTLVSISDLSWNHDMAPWDCPAVFPKGDPFTGGADAYIHQLTEQILPEAERRIGSEPVWRGIAGYSLAGLFAIYTLYHTDLFSRAASMSGSLWFPGFSEYMESHSLAVRPDCIYLSLGKKEHKTRNPLMKTVAHHTEKAVSCFQSQNIHITFEWNEGGHFDHPDQRTAAGIQWITEQH